jgi:hypothetical protein
VSELLSPQQLNIHRLETPLLFQGSALTGFENGYVVTQILRVKSRNLVFTKARTAGIHQFAATQEFLEIFKALNRPNFTNSSNGVVGREVFCSCHLMFSAGTR